MLSPLLPGTIVVVVVVLGAVLLGVAALWQWEARKAVREGAQEELERQAPSFLVADADPTRIGVDRAAQDVLPGGEVPEYVPRDADAELRAAVEAAFAGTGKWLVVVMGPSKVGKSRAAFEAVRHCAPGSRTRLVAPVDAGAVSALTTASDDRGPHDVLWLDDLEPFLNDGLTLAALEAWRDRNDGGIVVATYGGKGSERLGDRAIGGLGSIASQVLGSAEEIPLEATTADEIRAVRVPPGLAASLARHGLAAYLVAAPELDRKLVTRRHAPGDVECPEGAAAVYAAVDWARCGRTDAISARTLRTLWQHYLPPHTEPSEDAFERALDWACRPVSGSVSLLQRGEGYAAFDYVVRSVRDRPASGSPPGPVWEAAIETAHDAQATSVAHAAYLHRELERSMVALTRARRSSTGDVAAMAGYNLGVVLDDLDRVADAVLAYDEVLSRFGAQPEPALRDDIRVALLFNKGAALGKLGRSEEAVAAYDELLARYLEATDPELRAQAAKALVNKGFRLAHLGRREESIAIYDQVLERFGGADDMNEQVARALVGKGFMLGELGRLDAEIAVYDELVARLDTATEPSVREQLATALVNKSVALEQLERPGEALAACDEVITRFGGASEPELQVQVAKALMGKGVRLARLGRSDEAVGPYDELLRRDRTAANPLPPVDLAMVLLSRALGLGQLGRTEEELDAYDEVVVRFGEESDPELQRQVAIALFNKGVKLGRSGRPERELEAYDELVARFGTSSDADLRERTAGALVNKAITLQELDRPEGELEVYEDVLARFGEAHEPELREQVARALIGKGAALRALGRPDAEVAAAYDEVVARFGDSAEPFLQDAVELAREYRSQI